MDTGKHARENIKEKSTCLLFPQIAHQLSLSLILIPASVNKNKQQGQREGTWKTRVEACMVSEKKYLHHFNEISVHSKACQYRFTQSAAYFFK